MNDSTSDKPKGGAKGAPARRAASSKAGGEAEVLENIAAMPDADRVLATRIHDIVKASAPSLKPRLWYGMPAYARDAKVVCFFQSAGKFKTRYATLGFQHEAHLDEGNMWPVAYALIELSPTDEATIADLIKKAAG